MDDSEFVSFPAYKEISGLAKLHRVFRPYQYSPSLVRALFAGTVVRGVSQEDVVPVPRAHFTPLRGTGGKRRRGAHLEEEDWSAVCVHLPPVGGPAKYYFEKKKNLAGNK